MLYIGKLVNTHGIKGEVKIISDFKYKEIVFKKGNSVYIDDIKYKINTYRKHQKYDMITIEGIDNINDALPLKGKTVYINKEEYIFPGPLNEDLYGKKVYDKDKYIGILKEIIKNTNQEILVIKNENKEYLIPYVDEFIKEINEDIHLDLIKGFIDED
ncbi:MAG: 16S rRNA processing protein RimM [Bacilli bacterium]|nr:16S rRNA processing protein RimM [Bacilli bacterium]